jgi:hypothetical protein
MLGILLDAEKIQPRIGVMPDGRRLKIGVIQSFDLESNGIQITADPDGPIRFIPGSCDICGNLYRKITVGSAAVEI